MKIYGHHGFRRFVLCLGYKSWLIKEFFLRYREHVSDFTIADRTTTTRPTFHDHHADEDWEVTCAETGLTTATGARLWRVRDYVDTDTFMFTYGDGIGSGGHQRRCSTSTTSRAEIGTVTGVHPTSRYGEMRVDGRRRDRVQREADDARGLRQRRLLRLPARVLRLPQRRPEPVLRARAAADLARDGELAVFPHEDFWMGMDTYREYTELNELWAAVRPPGRSGATLARLRTAEADRALPEAQRSGVTS